MNDVMAAGCYAVARRRNLRIPEDLSVVGFDNQNFAAYLCPGLTTVALPNRQIGVTAAQYLLKRLESDADIPAHTTLPCSRVLRDSAAACPGGVAGKDVVERAFSPSGRPGPPSRRRWPGRRRAR